MRGRNFVAEIDHIISDGEKRRARQEIEAAAAVARAVDAGEAVVVFGVRYIPAPDQAVGFGAIIT